MRNSCILFISVFLSVFPVLLQAQEYEVEVTASNKTIWVSKLSLPSDMALLDYLLTLPELVDRNADTFLERFDIKLDGKLIGDSKDAFLHNTFLREIEKIVISTSPSDAHIKNGISGSVNIVPRPMEKGFSGDATVQSSLFTGVMPTANLRYSDGKRFEMRADINFDIYYPTKLAYQEKMAETFTMSGTDTTRENYLGQMARVYAKWKISDKDVLKLWVWQNYMQVNYTTKSFSSKLEDMSGTMGPGWMFRTSERTFSESHQKQLTFNAMVDYTRTIETGELNVNANYHGSSDYPGQKDEFNMELKSVTKFRIPDRKLNLDAVINFSSISNRHQQNSMLYFSPFLKLDYNGEHIKAILNGRYKGYSRNYCVAGGRPFNGWSQDWTAEGDILWQIVKHHAVRLKLIRSAGVVSNNLVYPELAFDEGAQVWRKGNPDLKGPMTGSANLEYITDWSKDMHHIVFDISAELNMQDRVVENSILFDGEKKVAYVYPRNTSYGNILGLTAMLNYSYGPFSMSFGGNLFYNTKYSLFNRNQASYFNVMFAPSVQLRKNWLINAHFLYNSKMYKDNVILGDCSLLTLRVSKVLKKWTLFASLRDVFDGISTDVEYAENETLYKTYDPYLRTFELGASFHF